MQRIHVDKGDSFQKKESVDFGTRATGIDSFQKKESVDLGTQCTEESKILVSDHFFILSTISSQFRKIQVWFSQLLVCSLHRLVCTVLFPPGIALSSVHCAFPPGLH
jgi:hypothetical protein